MLARVIYDLVGVQQCAADDARRAQQCHELIGKLTGASGTS